MHVIEVRRLKPAVNATLIGNTLFFHFPPPDSLR
jgi:hypothetical protein